MGGSKPTIPAEVVIRVSCGGDSSTASATGGECDDPERKVLDALDRSDHRTALLLCARHYGRDIGRLCIAMVGSQAEAEDLVQETLLAAHDAFESYRREGSLPAWLCGIARRRCARHLESGSRRAAKLHLVVAEEPATESDELVIRGKRATEARKALASLRPSDREALLLRYVSDLSYRDLAAACNIEEPAARQRVSRALMRLREVLAAEGYCHD